MKTAKIIFPNQLFKESSLDALEGDIFMVEEFLFFKQYNFHQQKIAFHRASMKAYQTHLKEIGKDVNYIESTEKESDVRDLIHFLASENYTHIVSIHPEDNWLEKRLKEETDRYKISLTYYQSPQFLNTREELKTFFKNDKKKFLQTEFYILERKKRKILVTNTNEPIGGKWTYDTENRKKYPKDKIPPKIDFLAPSNYHIEAITYTKKNFGYNFGNCDTYYPLTFKEAESWLDLFITERLADFGHYEDALTTKHAYLNHSLLTPMLNVGLLTPQLIVDKVLAYAKENEVSLNSLEGFVRQIIGWREFIRGIYITKGTYERTKNFWGFTRKIPASFYTGTTGIFPVDDCIQKIKETGYAHHIERLMILGNFMLLCEFDPDEVYRWFMEVFIDAYDWVMVTNVYGMSQFADGGLMATKPYISGSNYLMKMSDYKKGDWQEKWDGLFWHFMDKQRDFFLKNPRLSMLIHMFDKNETSVKIKHLKVAEAFLAKL
jgi:deoxyribodipyrimidine photolyase-related protein